MNQTRIHVRFDDDRSTVSVDAVLFELMALQLGHQPDDAGALPAVREWLNEALPSKVGTKGGRLKKASQGARVLLVEAIADKTLSQRRDEWFLENNGARTLTVS